MTLHKPSPAAAGAAHRARERVQSLAALNLPSLITDPSPSGPVIGIDPGAHGAIAVIDDAGQLLDVIDMPATPEARHRRPSAGSEQMTVAAATTTVPAPSAGAQEADPDAQLNDLLAGIDDDARILASIALGASREANFGDDIPALRAAINTARLVVIRMAQGFNKLESLSASGRAE